MNSYSTTYLTNDANVQVCMLEAEGEDRSLQWRLLLLFVPFNFVHFLLFLRSLVLKFRQTGSKQIWLVEFII